MLEYDEEEIKWAICDRYTAGEIVEILGLDAEEIYDDLKIKIIKNLDLFYLINLDGYMEWNDETNEEIPNGFQEEP